MQLIRALRNRFIHKESIANNTFVGFNTIGIGVQIGKNPVFQFKERIDIGNYVYIGNNASMNGRGKIVIGDYSIISDEVIILSSQHNYLNANMLPYDQIEILSQVVIGRSCWIGTRVIVLPGVQIEEGCVVGAGAVVTKSFPKGSIIAGNPAIIVEKRDINQFEKLIEEGRFYMFLKGKGNLSKVEKRVHMKKINNIN